MGDVDIYADVVSTLAMVVASGSLGWQIKSNWWDRPNIVFEHERVMTQRETAPGREADLGWLAEVTVSNTGNAETTLLSVEWEFGAAPDNDPSTFVAGNIGDGELTIDVEDIAPGVTKTTLQADEGSDFQPIAMGRNHSQRYAYRMAQFALEGRLGKATRARPVARFIDRKRRFGPKRHGVEVKYGEWTLAPRPDRTGPLPPGIRVADV